MIKGRSFKLLSSLLVATFLLAIFSISFLKLDFDQSQLSKYSKSQPEIAKATIAWPRLISKPNDLNTFQERLEGWKIESEFLIFRQMSDPTGGRFILIGAKNYQDYLLDKTAITPSKCDQTICEVIAAYPEGGKVIDPLPMGLKIVGSSTASKTIPIPKDFGVDKSIPILITPLVDQLSIWQPFRYLPASYGWQITPSNLDNLSAPKYKKSLSILESTLRAEFENVAVNYPADRLALLAANQDRIFLLAINALKVILLIFLLLLLLLFVRRRPNRFLVAGLIAASFLVIALLWSYQNLIQIVIYSSLLVGLLYLIKRVVDRYLLKNDFNTLSLYRSSLRTILSILLLTSLITSVSLSSFQYLSRVEQIRNQLINQKTPLDFTLKVGPSLTRPLDLGSVDEIKQLAAGGEVVPVIRAAGVLLGNNGEKERIKLLAAGGDKKWQEAGIQLPPGNQISVSTQGIADEIDLIIWLRSNTGAHFSITTTGSRIRTAVIPKQVAKPVSIVAFKLSENPLNAARREHALGESKGRAFDLLAGEGSINSISVGATPVVISNQWPIFNFKYALLDGPITLRPEIPQVTPNLIKSSDIKGGYDQIQIGSEILTIGDQSNAFDYQVMQSPYAQIDLAQYQMIVAKSEPYGVDPREIWVKTKDYEQFEKAFFSSKFNSLQLISRAQLTAQQSSSAYWQSWQKIFYTSLLFIIALIFIALLILFNFLNYDRKKKSFEMSKYFATDKPRFKPLVILVVITLLAATPILLISRFISGVIA